MNKKKLVLISDTHNMHDQLKIPECDLLIHAGDFTRTGSFTEMLDFIGWIRRQPAKEVYVIPGNHDTWCEVEPATAQGYFNSLGLYYGTGFFGTRAGLNIYGAPWQFNLEGSGFYRDPSRRFESWLYMPPKTNIVVTHIPPYKKGDRVHKQWPGEPDPHVGCPELLERVATLQPVLHIYGHIHEGRGRYEYVNGVTTALNVASIDHRYQQVHDPVVVELVCSPDGSWVVSDCSLVDSQHQQKEE